ncbi:MAG: RagB/SusD family nutrient uptake outer membrane protein [Saprospiraceae bacterium]|nr:RagB/SusD family nutrient uptake outer membrane protein [Saprospiraceae bacterium]
MKKILYISFLTLFLLSCSEDFLELSPSGALPEEDAIQSLSDMETLLLGAYSQLQNSDYYGRYFILVPDVMSDDVKQNSSANRAKEWAEYSGTDLDFISEEIWTEVYEAINRFNIIINAEVDLPPEVSDEADQIIGEAMALRGLAHFDICRIYAQHYGFTPGASHPGIPIVTQFDETAEPGRSTVAEVYAAAIADLEAGISKMNVNGDGPGRMNKTAAQAILARIYFYMENYSQAESMATTVINAAGSLLPSESFLAAWAGPDTKPDALFEIIMTAVDNNGSDALGRMYINEGYGDYLPSDDLRLIIDPEDLRSTLFKPDSTVGGGTFGWDRMNKFPSVIGDDNTPVIRLTEVMLIRAECRARNNNEDGAIEDMMAVRRRAWQSAPEVSLSGNDLIEEIIKERRIELAYEGHRLWDLMRLKRDVVRTDCTAPICTISYPNDRFILPIPAQELDANEAMEQNPGY